MYLLYSGTLFFWGLILCNLNSNWSTTYGRSWWSTFLKNSDSQICIQYLLETLGIYSLLSLKKQTKSIYSLQHSKHQYSLPIEKKQHPLVISIFWGVLVQTLKDIMIIKFSRSRHQNALGGVCVSLKMGILEHRGVVNVFLPSELFSSSLQHKDNNVTLFFCKPLTNELEVFVVPHFQ